MDKMAQVCVCNETGWDGGRRHRILQSIAFEITRILDTPATLLDRRIAASPYTTSNPA